MLHYGICCSMQLILLLELDIIFGLTSLYFIGLLTVDASRRLTITELLQDEWLQGGPPYLFSATPLMTPTILSARPTLTGPISAEAGVKQAFHAFHMATREGFRLLVSDSCECLLESKQLF